MKIKTTLIPCGGFIVCGTALLFATALRAADSDDTQIATATQHIDTMASVNGDASVSTTIADRFTKFAGSSTNAQALVTGLRTGSSVTLTESVNGQVSTATFTPATTGTQGFGSVLISLALAQEDLAKAGISHPTPAQIEAALNGGTITNGSATTQLPGVLQLRASGEGWGQIAAALDLKVGRVERELHRADEQIEKAGKAERAEADEKADKAEDRMEKVERAERPERPETRPDLDGVRDQLDLSTAHSRK
jgi:hypothetical protein